MDDPTKIMSTDYDIIYIQEAIELTEDDWESLTTRLRNAKMPFQQIIGDTNPSYPTHWLKVRCNSGRTKLYQSHHEDNPSLHDGTNWTPGGIDYISKLDALTGARKERLRFGRWVQAEGVVYENWDERVHLIPWFNPPADWPRYIAIDFGFRDPMSMLWFAKDGDGRLYLYREVYQTGRLVEDHARFIKAISARETPPLAIICDPEDREGRETISRYTGMSTTAADKQRKLLIGIQLVQNRLCVRGDGKPGLYVMRDALVYRDRELREAKRPTCLAEEIQSYIWRDAESKEEPEDRDNHSLDALRYLVTHLDLRQSANLDIIFIG